MLTLSPDMIQVLQPFAQAFTARTWAWVQILLVGAILTPGRRTVTAILRVMGLSGERQFQRYHRVLNRVKWSGLLISRILVTMLVATFVAAGVPLVIAADATIERRTGERITAKGLYRDAVRSSKNMWSTVSGCAGSAYKTRLGCGLTSCCSRPPCGARDRGFFAFWKSYQQQS